MLLVLLASWGAILWHFRQALCRLWREPVLRHPVMIIESDDWGPGPQHHADALVRITEVLQRHRDDTGRAAIMTIGAVLAVPDNDAIRASGYRAYPRRTLADPDFTAVRNALADGSRQGVLALQLHGLEHLWPPAFIKAAQAPDGEVRRWIDTADACDTESLPSHIQSRWTDASVLPSIPLEHNDIEAAVAEEVEAFRAAFGSNPLVVVPPTFVWNAEVERAWAERGVRVLITPGIRFCGRDALGKPGNVDRTYANGESLTGGMTSLVRDAYFEPSYGHTPQRAVRDLMDRTALGRPTLFETHRFNFTGSPQCLERSLDALDRLLSHARSELAGLRFMSPLELAQAYRVRDPQLFMSDRSARLHCLARRASRIGRLRKLAWLTGLVLPVGLIYLIASATTGRPTSSGSLFS